MQLVCMHVCMGTHICNFLVWQGCINELEQREGDHLALQQRFDSLNKHYTDLQALNSYLEARTKGQHSQNAQQSADPAEEDAEGEEDEDEDEGADEGEDEDSSD